MFLSDETSRERGVGKPDYMYAFPFPLCLKRKKKSCLGTQTNKAVAPNLPSPLPVAQPQTPLNHTFPFLPFPCRNCGYKHSKAKAHMDL